VAAHPAEGAIEIVELGQRFLALGISDHDHAGEVVDRPQEPDRMVRQPLAVVADQGIFGLAGRAARLGGRRAEASEHDRK